MKLAAGHFAGIFASVAYFTVLTFVLYIAAVFSVAETAGDLGGPLLFVIFPFLAGVAGAAISALIYCPLGFVAQRFRVQGWGALAMGLLAGLFLIVAVPAWIAGETFRLRPRWSDWLVIYSVSGFYAASGFAIYLACLTTTEDFFGR